MKMLQSSKKEETEWIATAHVIAWLVRVVFLLVLQIPLAFHIAANRRQLRWQAVVENKLYNKSMDITNIKLFSLLNKI